MAPWFPPFFFLFTLFLSFESLQSQQIYVNNTQFQCYNNDSTTFGNICNGVKTCNSFLIFRSQPPYFDSAVTIGRLLNTNPSKIAQFNKIAEIQKIPSNTEIIVPVNCSCSGNYYQYNASYTLNFASETYLTVANNTYQGLTTCQAIMNQNVYDSRNLSIGLNLLIPLRCVCPSTNQSRNGVKFLLTYLLAKGDDVSSISERFGVDEEAVNYANDLFPGQTIFYFTPLLIPLKTEPTLGQVTVSPPPAQPPKPPNTVPSKKSSKTWVFAVIGVGAGFTVLSLCGFLVFFFYRRRRHEKPVKKIENSTENGKILPQIKGELPSDNSVSVSVFSKSFSEFNQSLTLYKFEELQRATKDFSPDCRIKGSVYQGTINGDLAAIKRVKGDISTEINILKQINHSNVIRLSGFCSHKGNSYLVYEFAEHGSLSDLLHGKNTLSDRSWSESINCLSWKQRIQIACDIAEGLNYLHNYTNPAYIHKDLKSSNVLLDHEFRAKIANFGLARSLQSWEQEQNVQLTRHVVGTQGYMAPEYLEYGLITLKLDVFAFGVIMLELMSGREAVTEGDNEEKTGDVLLWAAIKPILEGDNAREKLRGFVDPCLRDEYSLDLALDMARLAASCLCNDLSARPGMSEISASLLKILSLSLDWELSDSMTTSRSAADCR